MADDTFSRMHRLLGDTSMTRLAQSRVIVFGIGGVGGWCAEALVRSGVCHLTLVDADVVCRSNINRQVMALNSTLGQPKVEVMRDRLLDINPNAHICAVQMRYTAATAPLFCLDQYDYAIDAIDSLADKAELILQCTSMRNLTFFSSMGAALKLNPERISVADFSKVKGCRLAAALRNRFKRMNRFPRKFKCVFSDESLPNLGENEDESGAMTYGKVAYNGAAMHITAMFGLRLASLVITDLTKQTKN